MTKISNQTSYVPDTDINNEDYFIGTDADNSLKTVNFKVGEVGSHYNMTNGIKNFDFNFYQHVNANPNPVDGGFYSNDNNQDPNNITYFIFSKKTSSNKIIASFFENLITLNPFDLTISQKVDIMSTFYFKIDSIESFHNYYKINVSEIYFPEITILEYTLSFNLFSLKTEGVTQHNNLLGLNDGDYIHLTAEEKTKLDNLPETFPTKTSDLTNDGSDGTSTYVEASQLGLVATSNDYNDLDNLPIVPAPITNTSELVNDGADGINPFITQNDVINNTNTSDLINDGSDSTSTYVEADEISNLIREEFTFSGSQTFTLSNNYGQVYSVEVQGQGALSTSQYTLAPTNQVIINDTLDTEDYVIIIYSTATTGLQPYYSQAEVDVLLNNKLNKDFTTLTNATLPLVGTEEVAVIQGGETKKVAVSEVGSEAVTQYPKVICFQRKNLPNLTGTTTVTKMGSFVIPANTIPADCVIRMTLRMANSGTANIKFVYTTWNSVNAGINIFSNYVTFTNSTRPELLLRRLGYVSAGTFESYGLSGIYDEVGSTAAYQSFAFDVTVDNEIDIWGKLVDASDTIIFNTLILEILA